MKIRWCNRDPCPPLPHHTLVTSERQFRSILEQYDLQPVLVREHYVAPGACATMHTFKMNNEYVCLVGVSKGHLRTAPYVEVVGTLVHEAVHIFQRYCEYLCERAPSKEFEAYAIERITKNLLELAMRIRK